MKKIKGLPVSEGIAIGKARLISKEKHKIKKRKIDEEQIENELEKFKKTIAKVTDDIDTLVDDLSLSKLNRDILTTHKMIVEDPEFHKNVKKKVKTELKSLEKAVDEHFEEVSEMFESLDNDYMAGRSSDYREVKNRLLNHILGKDESQEKHDFAKDSILVMHEVSIALITHLFKNKIAGICTEEGGKTSHTAIIARSMNLPMLTGVNKIQNSVEDGQEIILDCEKGFVYIEPNEEIRNKYKQELVELKAEKEKLNKIKDKKTQTLDGYQIKLMSNIEIPEETELVLQNQSDGIGLFRTEFLFIGKKELPTEAEQTEIYKQVATKIYPQDVIIRTIDVGGDKVYEKLDLIEQENPNLGLRGIRISLSYKELFETQLRALFNANVKGNIKILLPMISDVAEIIETKKIIDNIKPNLTANEKDKNFDIELGAMIEIPSAALNADAIIQECDFLSIGTNDLIQYTLAADRDNPGIQNYYRSSNPAVFKLIKMTIESAHKFNKKVAVCGEMAGRKAYIPLLLGMGVDSLSVSPGIYLESKKCILDTEMKQAKDLVNKVLNMKNVDKIDKLLKGDKKK